MNNVVTIRAFQRNLYSFIKKGSDIVVTSKGNNLFKVVFCRDNDDNVVTTKESNVTTLKQNIKNIEENVATLPEKKRKCLACQKLGKVTEAIGEFEITTDDGEHKVWLCQQHKNKQSLS